ncbi:MAG: hypothetical protein ACLU4P_01710 [Ruminococcus sp.]
MDEGEKLKSGNTEKGNARGKTVRFIRTVRNQKIIQGKAGER